MMAAINGDPQVPGDGEFACAQCGGVFQKDWTDAEANAEKVELFAGHVKRGEAFDVVCDPCFEAIGATDPVFRGLMERLAKRDAGPK